MTIIPYKNRAQIKLFFCRVFTNSETFLWLCKSFCVVSYKPDLMISVSVLRWIQKNTNYYRPPLISEDISISLQISVCKHNKLDLTVRYSHLPGSLSVSNSSNEQEPLTENTPTCKKVNHGSCCSMPDLTLNASLTKEIKTNLPLLSWLISALLIIIAGSAL